MALTEHLQPIPHPPGRLFVGNLFDLDPNNPIESLMALARQYGPIYRLDTPGRSLQYVVSGCALVDERCHESRFDKMLGPGLRALRTAFSRLPVQPKCYVQQVIKEHSTDVWRLLQQEAVVFVCGDASRMAPDVRRAFAEVFREHTDASEADAQAWLTGLVAANRYLEDIWATGG